MIDALAHFHFLRPEWLLLLPAAWGLERLVARRERLDDPFRGIITPALLEHLRVRPLRNHWFNPSTALAALLVLVTLILAGPSWRQQPSPLAEDAAPLILLMDVSESMKTQDIAPSRLERARQKMSDLLALMPDKRVAIVVFAGSAHTVLPLTGDHDITRSYLNGLTTGLAPRAGKFAEYALPSIDRLVGKSPYRANIVMVTDGLGTATTDLMSAWCARTQHQLVVYGLGSPDSRQTDTPLDRAGLERLGNRCGGMYVEVSVDTRDVERIADNLSDSYRIIDDEALPWLDGGYPLVFPALALALLWFRKGWTRVWVWLLLPTLLIAQSAPVSAQVARDRAIAETPEAVEAEPSMLEQGMDSFVGLWLTPDQYGRVLLSLGEYRKAARTFENPVWQAIARYYAEDFRQAATLFLRKDSDPALFNEANAHAHRRDYVRALRSYDTLLTRNPQFPGAQSNRDLVQKIVDDINRLSESQAQEQGVSGEDIDPDEDPQIADGADQVVMEPAERKQYSAEEILASPETAELWLNNVQQDPADFLRTKFSVQLEERGVSEP